MTKQPEPWAAYLRPELAELSVYDVPPASSGARLHANECAEAWPAHVMARIAEVVRQAELGRYPDTSGRTLRALLAKRHECEPERIVLGNGSDEVIAFLLTALSGPTARAIVIPDPTFVMYGHTARVMGLHVRRVALDADLQLDVAGLRVALAQPGACACFLARPNNPTGSVFQADAIRALVVEHPATTFVVDEAYVDYSPGQSLWAPDNPPNMVHMSTLSKVGLAAIRLGYCIANPELALALNKVRHPYNVSRTSLAIAHTILSEFGDEQAVMIEQTIANRDRLSGMLSRIPGARVYPSGANLVLVRLAEPAHAEELTRRLAGDHILVKDVSRLQGLGGCVRISVGTTDELNALERALGV